MRSSNPQCKPVVAESGRHAGAAAADRTRSTRFTRPVPSRPAKRPQLTGARQRLGFTHRETRTFPVPWQGGPARVPPRAPKAPPRNGRARRHQKAHDKMEQSVTEGGCLAVTHARAAGRQPAFQVTSVAIPPPCPSQQLMPIPGAPTAGTPTTPAALLARCGNR